MSISINRHKIDDDLLQEVILGLRGKVTTTDATKFIKKFPKLHIKKGKLFLGDRHPSCLKS